jgi:hypothetical protein
MGSSVVVMYAIAFDPSGQLFGVDVYGNLYFLLPGRLEHDPAH